MLWLCFIGMFVYKYVKVIPLTPSGYYCFNVNINQLAINSFWVWKIVPIYTKQNFACDDLKLLQISKCTVYRVTLVIIVNEI